MAKKREINEELKELKGFLLQEKAIFGADRVLKKLKLGELQKIFLANNVVSETLADIKHYAQLANVSLVELDVDNEELGIFCKKNFFISVIGITA